MKSPNADMTILFKSIPLDNHALEWQVHLVFPANTAAGGDLLFYVTDKDDAPIPSGTFNLSGGDWKFTGGRGRIPYSAFIAGIHEKEVWLRRPGIESVPGGLTFG